MYFPFQVLFVFLEREFQKRVPKLRVIQKSTSWLHRTIAFFLKFPWVIKSWQINDRYLSDYWTTLGFTIAYPTDPKTSKEEEIKELYGSWPILCHEMVHVLQAKKYTRFLFGLTYLLGTPVYFILFGLIDLVLLPVWLKIDIWWISLIILGIGAVLSIPYPFAYFRARAELEAYTLSMCIKYWQTGKITALYLSYLEETFTGPSYFFMWLNKNQIKKWLDTRKADIISGDVLSTKYVWHEFYQYIYNTMKKWELTRVTYDNTPRS